MKISVKDLGLVLSGFYVAAVIFAYADNGNKSIFTILNSLGTFISGGGAIAAILTIVQVSSHRRQERAYAVASSRINQLDDQFKLIESCLFDREGPKNNRVEWTQAAKCILYVNRLLESFEMNDSDIRFDELKVQISVKADAFRMLLYKNLCISKNNLSGSLPISFFYGVPEWKDISASDAIHAHKRNTQMAYEATEVAPPMGISKLDKKSVFIVGSFIAGDKVIGEYDSLKLEDYSSLKANDHLEGFAKYIRQRT
ncbi:hypothetical protein MX824_004911 [Vibrio parahaemolyticus]|uniref:hypothetical protein n=1 Tax=Vibrio TaxID=662 RepID=UPI0010DB95E8|nr:MULTISPECIES: hypothetical protein [Vibrio]HDY7969835.1 hypothetical protein [Vibrio vulnificus]EJC6765554.1 hypothetical protein [Vibrio parahaemolyticus]EJC6784197.1 hypothetical protein [Vibrio parahaemolyticus]EJC6813379.1 hypothetical protein [Vibrio parahaemolyticus]EJC6928014.1 hypothetical protein [Vibrio parahaemolyticus]